MKTLTKNSVPELWSNPISRSLILILVAALVMATFIVSAAIVAYHQW